MDTFEYARQEKWLTVAGVATARRRMRDGDTFETLAVADGSNIPRSD